MPIYNNFYLLNKNLSPTALQGRGPVLSVEVSIPIALADSLTKEGKALSSPQVGFALFDTGASNTCVDRDVVAALGIPSIGIQRVYTPQGNDDQYKYPARISFPGTPLPPVDFGSVYGASLKSQGIIALIGRDLLTHFVFTYNGPGGFITVAY